MCAIFGRIKLYCRKVAAFVFGHCSTMCQLFVNEVLVRRHLQNALLHNSLGACLLFRVFYFNVQKNACVFLSSPVSQSFFNKGSEVKIYGPWGIGIGLPVKYRHKRRNHRNHRTSYPVLTGSNFLGGQEYNERHRFTSHLAHDGIFSSISYLVAVKIKVMVFWLTTPCSQVR